MIPVKPISHQTTSGALVHHSSPPQGLWLWSSLPPTRCWSSQSEPGHTSQYGQTSNRIFLLYFMSCFLFKMWSQTFRRSLNLRFSREVGSNMILSAFSSDNVRNIQWACEWTRKFPLYSGVFLSHKENSTEAHCSYHSHVSSLHSTRFHFLLLCCQSPHSSYMSTYSYSELCDLWQWAANNLLSF